MDYIQIDDSARSPENQKRIREIVSFMKGVSVFVDAEVEIVKHNINLEGVTEEQLMYLITHNAIRNAPTQKVYEAVNTLRTVDVMMLNLSAENLEYFIVAVGAFFFARAVKKMISKNDILVVRELLGANVHKAVIAFALESHTNEYPLRPPFKEQFHAAGHRIFEVYFSDLPTIVQEISMMRTGYTKPEKDMSYLKISKDYALELVKIVQNYTLGVT